MTPHLHHLLSPQHKALPWPKGGGWGRWLLILGLGLSLSMGGCAVRGMDPKADPDSVGLTASWLARQQVALAEADLLPAATTHETHDLMDVDTTRNRAVNARLYLPLVAVHGAAPVPLVVFSHGIGGSRLGYSHLGRYWAANGVASLHVQHVGSDSQLWVGNPFKLLGRLQQAAQATEALDRVQDLHHALDRVLAHPQWGTRIDAQRLVAAGHSYGANTVLLATGAAVPHEGRVLALADPRFKAAVIISAPPFHGQSDPEAILRAVQLPTLHITSEEDDIRIPGYRSTSADRVAVYRMTGSPDKSLVVYREGAHSMFTDRLSPGGEALNAQVKRANRDLTLAFFQRVLMNNPQAWAQWPQQHLEVLAQHEGPLWPAASAPAHLPRNPDVTGAPVPGLRD